ncbi:MAG: phosphoribosylformimino-5-aminoimidazole carboxamide ribotide isomerase [Chitinispirillaceae bacterium]|nr:phosphoribosylformimino-5-aminoimidazole carboxamide ribotide isomerase [Chitinispirillaceae bacterium]
MLFRPCIDLHQGKVKQIVGSTLNDRRDRPVTNFESDRPPAYYARLYREEGLSGGHVIMLGPGNEDAAVAALREFPGGLQVGGGIRPDSAAAFLDQGASHVIVTSYVFSEGEVRWDGLEAMEKMVGKKRLVLDVSCRRFDGKYVIATNRWQTMSGVALSRELLERLAGRCDEFLVHAVDVEGKRQGIDGDLVAFLAEASPIVTTYAGGIRSIEDLEAVWRRGKGRVDATIGSALNVFGGALKLEEVVAWHRKRNPRIFPS